MNRFFVFATVKVASFVGDGLRRRPCGNDGIPFMFRCTVTAFRRFLCLRAYFPQRFRMRFGNSTCGIFLFKNRSKHKALRQARTPKRIYRLHGPRGPFAVDLLPDVFVGFSTQARERPIKRRVDSGRNQFSVSLGNGYFNFAERVLSMVGDAHLDKLPRAWLGNAPTKFALPARVKTGNQF